MGEDCTAAVHPPIKAPPGGVFMQAKLKLGHHEYNPVLDR